MAIALALSILAAGCSKETQNTPPTPPASSAPPVVATPSASTSAPTTGRAPRKDGEMCGGFAGFRCDEGLDCVTPPPMYPDKSGTCQKKK